MSGADTQCLARSERGARYVNRAEGRQQLTRNILHPYGDLGHDDPTVRPLPVLPIVYKPPPATELLPLLARPRPLTFSSVGTDLGQPGDQFQEMTVRLFVCCATLQHLGGDLAPARAGAER